jgi:hypothetical protein
LLTSEKQHAQLRRRRRRRSYYVFLTEEEQCAMFSALTPGGHLADKVYTLFSYFSSAPSNHFVLPAANLFHAQPLTFFVQICFRTSGTELWLGLSDLCTGSLLVF